MQDMTHRKLSLDVIRCAAILFVISVHFLFQSGFYNTVITGNLMIGLTFARWLFYICVPLFLILSGYLMRRKTFSKQYYLKLGRTLYIYLFASIACNIFKVIYLKVELSALDWFKTIFNFTAAPYSWYVNMYIGLYLLIPFINIIYNELKTKKHKQLLILTMITLTSAPFLFNIKYQVLPDWWCSAYPITFYFIGNYLSEFSINIKKIYLFAVLVLTLIFETMVTAIACNNEVFSSPLDNYAALPTLIAATIVFILLLDVKVPDNYISRIVKSISDVSLSMYLVSWIFDKLTYKVLNDNFTTMQEKAPYFFLVVPVVFVLSYSLSIFIHFTYKCVSNAQVFFIGQRSKEF